MFTYKFYTKSENESIRLRIINNRRKAEIAIGLYASTEDVENALSQHPKSKNAALASALSSVSHILKQMQCEYLEEGKSSIDVKEICSEIKKRLFFSNADHNQTKSNSSSFAKFFTRCINAKANEGYRASCKYTYDKISLFCKEKDVDYDSMLFEDINLKWLNSFDEWLVKHGASKNTRNIHFKNIRTVMNRAIDEELTSNYPFRRFKIRPEATRKRSLPLEELRKLFTCNVEPYQEIYRDMFKLIFMLCGINAVDLYNLESITPDGRIEYRRAKTHRLYSIKVEPEALEIIEKYKGEKKLLCLADRWKSHRDFTKWINVSLKKIGEMKRIGKGGKKDIKPYWSQISSYWARHSWATIAYQIDVPKDIISQALGHSSGLDVTEIYIQRDEKKVDEANRRVLDWVLYGKR